MPRDKPHTEFESGAQIIHHLLRHRKISGEYASGGIDGRTRRSGSTCASADRVTTAGKPADVEGDRFQGPAADNAQWQHGAHEPGRPASQCDPRPQLRYAWLPHRWVPVSRRRP